MFDQWGNVPKPIIGMLHLRPLPGSPRYGGSIEVIRSEMLRDAQTLASGGVHGLMLENFGDVPFFPGTARRTWIAQMAALAGEVRTTFDLPLGINVLRNDGQAALAVAHAAGGAVHPGQRARPGRASPIRGSFRGSHTICCASRPCCGRT